MFPRKKNFIYSVIGSVLGGLLLMFIVGTYPVEIVLGLIGGSGLALYYDYKYND